MEITIAPPPGMEGVDELAGALGVKKWEEGNALVLEGRSGRAYNLAELLLAHIKKMEELGIGTVK